MIKTNKSLAKFSSFISSSAVVGAIALFIGIAIFVLNQDSTNPSTIFFAAFSLYLSSTSFGLAIVGSFLRQTAMVIVEGMGGNLNELEYSQPDYSASNSEMKTMAKSEVEDLPLTASDIHKIRVGWLSNNERARWEYLGRPDLSTWDGKSTFDKWVKTQSK